MSQYIEIPITWSVLTPSREDRNKRRFSLRLQYQCPVCGAELSCNVTLSKEWLERRDSSQRDLQVMLERHVLNRLSGREPCPECKESAKGREIFFQWEPTIDIHRMKRMADEPEGKGAP
jgi:hypothetical protein